MEVLLTRPDTLSEESPRRSRSENVLREFRGRGLSPPRSLWTSGTVLDTPCTRTGRHTRPRPTRHVDTSTHRDTTSGRTHDTRTSLYIRHLRKNSSGRQKRALRGEFSESQGSSWTFVLNLLGGPLCGPLGCEVRLPRS